MPEMDAKDVNGVIRQHLRRFFTGCLGFRHRRPTSDRDGRI